MSVANILFLMADQFRGDIMNCCKGPANTPNLDLLAAEGIRFNCCFTSSPLCIPARVSLFTGKYPHSTGVWDNFPYIVSPDANLWSKTLHDLGYFSALFGKTHLCGGKDLIKNEHFTRSYGFDVVDEIAGPHACAMGSRSYMTEEWKQKGVHSAFCTDIKSRIHASTKCVSSPTTLPLEDYYDVYVGRKGQEFLENYDGDKPWFCHVSFAGPHEPWDTPLAYNSLYDPAEMPAATARMTNTAADRPKGHLDHLMQNCPDLQCSPEQASVLRADYCGGVTLIDEMIGRIFDTIRKRGEWDNTIIIFTADHGEMNGDQGIIRKSNFLNGAIHVPLLIRTPETAALGGNIISDTLVNWMDVGPTLVELAGGCIDYEQFGKSLCDVIHNNSIRHREYILSELHGEIMYMDYDWKAVFNAQGEVYMLFDRQNDIAEQYNLAGSVAVQETERLIKEKLLKALFENQCTSPAILQYICN